MHPPGRGTYPCSTVAQSMLKQTLANLVATSNLDGVNC